MFPILWIIDNCLLNPGAYYYHKGTKFEELIDDYLAKLKGCNVRGVILFGSEPEDLSTGGLYPETI